MLMFFLFLMSHFNLRFWKNSATVLAEIFRKHFYVKQGLVSAIKSDCIIFSDILMQGDLPKKYYFSAE